MADDFGEDDRTVVDERDVITPTELPRCTECGAIVFFDDFTEPAAALAFGLFTSKQCVCSRATIGEPGSWYYCADRRKYVCYVP